MSLSRSTSAYIIGFAAALALAGALVPALASAQTYPYYNNNYYGSNCGQPYSGTYGYPYDPYISTYQYGNCQQGLLFVYVQVNAPVNSYYGRQPGDFTATISGGNAFPATIQGSPNGQLVSVLGSYSVTALSFQGFTPTYSSGCSGSVLRGQQASCVITENPIYPYNYSPNNYNYNQYPNQYSSQYPYVNQPYTNPYTAPSVYVTPTYVPRLPNTGFEPQSAWVTLALIVLIAMASFSLPYVRKALAAILG